MPSACHPSKNAGFQFDAAPVHHHRLVQLAQREVRVPFVESFFQVHRIAFPSGQVNRVRREG